MYIHLGTSVTDWWKSVVVAGGTKSRGIFISPHMKVVNITDPSLVKDETVRK
jgi:hypothetical protein